MTRSRVKKDFAVGIDDNATSTAITIDASQNVSLSNDLTVDTSTLVVDSTSNGVGIGTSSVDSGVKLHVQESDAGLVAQTGASVALFERAGNAGISIGCDGDGDTTVFFGDATNSTIGRVNYDHANNYMSFWTANNPRLYISNIGRVGIGTSEPQSQLDLYGTSSPPTYTGNIRVAGGSATAKGGIEFINTSFGTGYGWRVDAPDEGSGNTPIIFRSRSNSAAWTERMRVMSSGVLLVGGQTPAGGSAGSSGVVQAQGFGTKQGYNGAMRTNMFNIAWVSSSLQAWVDTTNVGTFSLTSDYRIKRNIESMSEPALARIAQLRPVTYQPANFNDLFQESDEVKEGFIAHELQEVIPSAVDGEKDAEDQIQSLKVDALCAVLTKAIQEQQTIIDSQASAIADLTARLEALEAN